jgi:hypothetical protein
VTQGASLALFKKKGAGMLKKDAAKISRLALKLDQAVARRSPSASKLRVALGQKLRDARRKEGVTQRAISQRLKLEPSYLCGVEYGTNSRPTPKFVQDVLKTIRRIARGK